MSSLASALKLENIVCARPSRTRVTIQPCVESFLTGAGEKSICCGRRHRGDRQ
jgi:hypothetical protein